MDGYSRWVIHMTLIFCSVLICCVARKSIEVRSIKRSHPLGTLYNSSTADLYETLPLTGTISAECVRKIKEKDINYYSAVIRSTRDELKAKGLEASAQLEAFGGLLKVGGRFAMSSTTQSSSSSVTAIVMAEVPTMEERLDINCKNLSNNYVMHVLKRTDANYFVSSVVYGFRYEIVFRAAVKVESSNTEMKASLSAHLRKLTASFEADVTVGSSTFEENSEFSVSFLIKGYADAPDRDLGNYTELLKYVRQLNSNITKSRDSERGMALYYICTPIEDFFESVNLDRSVAQVHAISDSVIEKALFVIDKAVLLHNEATELSLQLDTYSSCIPTEEFKNLVETLRSQEQAFKDFQANVSIAIRKERRGEDNKLAEVLQEYGRGDNSPESFEEVLRNKYASHQKSLSTMVKLTKHSINCLPVSVNLPDISIDYHNTTLVLLQYRTSSIDLNRKAWEDAVQEMLNICKTVNGSSVFAVQCFHIDCQFSKGVCVKNQEPIIRVAHKGRFIDLGNVTATEFLLHAELFPHTDLDGNFKLNKDKYDLMKRSLINMELEMVNVVTLHKILYAHLLAGQNYTLSPTDFIEMQPFVRRNLLNNSCYMYC